MEFERNGPLSDLVVVDWSFDGTKAWGEDHDNWTIYGYRRFFRSFLGYEKALSFEPQHASSVAKP